MPAPNDIFANAIVLNGTSGATTGNNLGAGSEPGEPPNNGRTVWYKWSPPAGIGTFFFSTCFNSHVFPASPPLQSVLQIFGGATISTLTEAAYFSGNNQEYAGWEFGGNVAVKYDNRIQSSFRTGGQARLLLSINCGLINGQVATIVGVSDSSFNNANVVLTVTVVSGTQVQVTYNSPGPDVGSTNRGGNVIGVYAVRVDGRLVGGAGAQGNFPLSWGSFSWIQLGGCGACQPDFFSDEQCAATPLSVADDGTGHATIGSTNSPSLPAGVYVARYCSGAVFGEMFYLSTPILTGWTAYTVITQSGSNICNLNFGGPPGGSIAWTLPAGSIQISPCLDGSSANPPPFSSQAECESNFRCNATLFQAEAGPWNMRWNFNNFDGNPLHDFPPHVIGNPGPTFGIFRIIPFISFVTASAAWVVNGSSATCNFTVNNENSVNWNNVTVSLDAFGGISGSSTLTGQTISPGGNTFTLSFNCVTPNVTAHVRFSSPYFPADVILTVFLGPLIVINSHSEARASTSCVPQKFFCQATFQNNGFWDETAATYTLTVTPSEQFYNAFSGCAVVGTGSINQGTSGGFTSSGSLAPLNIFVIDAALKPTGTIQPATLNWVFKDGSTTLLSTTYPITIPAS